MNLFPEDGELPSQILQPGSTGHTNCSWLTVHLQEPLGQNFIARILSIFENYKKKLILFSILQTQLRMKYGEQPSFFLRNQRVLMPPVMSLQYVEEELLGGLCCLNGEALKMFRAATIPNSFCIRLFPIFN